MSTVKQFREWHAVTPIQHGSAMVDADSIAEAEGYVTEWPVCSHGFATSAQVEGPKNEIVDAMKAAGYVADGRTWLKDGFAAVITHRNGRATAFISAAKARQAYQESNPESLAYGR